MDTLRGAVRAGLGLALFAAFFIISGCASGNTSDEPDRDVDAASLEITPGLFACTRGRGQGTLMVLLNGTCYQDCGNQAEASREFCVEGLCPSCESLSTKIGCTMFG